MSSIAYRVLREQTTPYLVPQASPRRDFLNWLAGFIDGEGCIHIKRREPAGLNKHVSYSLTLAIANTNRASLEYTREQLGFGGVYCIKQATNVRKPAWLWISSGNKVRRLLAELIPYLHIKRRQAEIAQEFAYPTGRRYAAFSAEDSEHKEVLYLKLRILNQRGPTGTVFLPSAKKQQEPPHRQLPMW